MRRRRKYRLPASDKEPGRGFLWLGALAVLATVGCIWWQLAQTAAPAPRVQARPTRLFSAPPTLRMSRPTAAAPKVASAEPHTVPPQPLAQAGRTVPRAPSELTETNVEPTPPAGSLRPAQNVLEAQIALDRHGISPGSLDGVSGPQTRSALRAFQRKERLPVTGELDPSTKERLVLDTPPCTTCEITASDLARLQPLSPTWLGKSQQSTLDYETLLELIAERGHAHPNLIRRLNPGVSWTNAAPGTRVQLPEVDCPAEEAKAAFIIIRLADKVLEAFDAGTNLLVHFPCSIAQRVEKRPVGALRVEVIAPNPNYTFDPDVFPESAEARQLNAKLVLPPGPNNPVGVAWIGLDKPGYGIHGTPSPEQVGRTESHGCFRLANWNAARLLRLVAIGTPVYVQP